MSLFWIFFSSFFFIRFSLEVFRITCDGKKWIQNELKWFYSTWTTLDLSSFCLRRSSRSFRAFTFSAFSSAIRCRISPWNYNYLKMINFNHPNPGCKQKKKYFKAEKLWNTLWKFIVLDSNALEFIFLADLPFKPEFCLHCAKLAFPTALFHFALPAGLWLCWAQRSKNVFIYKIHSSVPPPCCHRFFPPFLRFGQCPSICLLLWLNNNNSCRRRRA